MLGAVWKIIGDVLNVRWLLFFILHPAIYPKEVQIGKEIQNFEKQYYCSSTTLVSSFHNADGVYNEL